MKIYLVGGAVRDSLLHLPVHERDWVVTGATPETMTAQGYTPVGKDFPVFLHPQSKEEYALARTERKSGRGYKGFHVFADAEVTLEEDLKRRDLTINAIAKDESGQLIDPYHGQNDINEKTLRHVSEAFQEDPVRILRVARFAARFHHLGFSIAPDTMALMQTMVDDGEVHYLVAERVWAEFHKVLKDKNPEIFLFTLAQCGALQIIMPELYRSIERSIERNIERNDNHLEKAEDFFASQPIKTLIHACLLSPLPHVRFAALAHYIAIEENTDALEHLGKKIAAPKQLTRLAITTAQCRPALEQSMSLNAETLFAALEKSDALRQPEKLQECLLCCEAHTNAHSNSKNTEDIKYAWQAFLAIQKVQAKNINIEGLKGKDIGNALARVRIQTLEALISALPTKKL